MSDLEKKLEGIKRKMKEVLKSHLLIQEDQKKLAEKHQQTSTSLEDAENRVKELEKELNLSKISKTISETKKDNTDVKKKVNEFIREIDKCIALLNN